MNHMIAVASTQPVSSVCKSGHEKEEHPASDHVDPGGRVTFMWSSVFPCFSQARSLEWVK